MDKKGEIPWSCLAPGGAWKAEIWHASDETAVLARRLAAASPAIPAPSHHVDCANMLICMSKFLISQITIKGKTAEANPEVKRAKARSEKPVAENRGRDPQINYGSSIK